MTVRVATYNAGRLVAERALASARAQTYERIEIVVVGDSCDDATVDAVRAVDDPRIRFVNLRHRGVYPPVAHLRRKVAGAHPMNVGNLLADGAWICPLDDDDELTPDHVEVLLAAARSGPYEMVYSQADDETGPDHWTVVGSWPMRQGEISHGSVMYASALSFLPMSMTSWKRREPSDWNYWKRMKRIGVRIGYVPQVTFRHYLSEAGRTQLAAEGQSTHTADTPAT